MARMRLELRTLDDREGESNESLKPALSQRADRTKSRAHQGSHAKATSSNMSADKPKKHSPKPPGRQTLHFVKVTADSLQGYHDAEAQRSVRSHVMRDYLQHLKEPLPAPTALAMGADVSQHIGRFRSGVKARRGDRAGTRNEDESLRKDRSKDVKKLRPIKPLQDETSPSEDIPIDPALVNFQWKKSPIILPIDISSSDTSDLLEYYHTSFWANSFAVNPEGAWLPTALGDPAMLHATLSLVAQHRSAMTTQPLPKAYFRHRGKAMSIIASRLSDPDQAISDATIGAVAVLANADNHSLWSAEVHESHMRGLTTLVDLRGGLENLDTNMQIKRVVGWADLLHASAHDKQPRFDECRMVVDTALLARFVSQKVPALASPSFAALDIPRSVAEVCQRLHMLSAAKTSLVMERDRPANEVFSTMLYQTERSIFSLGPASVHADEPYSARSIWRAWPIYRAVKAASLIHTFHTLRDLPISAAFFESLTRRLRLNLSLVLEETYSQASPSSFVEDLEARNDTPDPFLDDYADPSLLLNLLMNGWKASVRRDEDRDWFRDQARHTCWMYQIETRQDFCDRVMQAMFSKEYCPTVARAFWKAIQS